MTFRNKINFAVRKKSLSNFFLSFLFILTFLLILFNKTDYLLANKIKHIGIDVISPMTKIISSPVTIVTNLALYVKEIRNLESENLKLQEEILRLKKWQTLAIKNSRENRVFKSLLNSTSDTLEIIKTASVINQSSNIYVNTVTINAGLNFV